MENYTITKEKVLQLHKNNSEGNDQLVSADLKEWFPNTFKTGLEAGKWYKGTADIDFLVCYQSNGFDNYGFLQDQPYRNNISFGDYLDDMSRSATPEEVKAALKTETIKRYGKDWENTKIKEHADGQPWIGNGLNKGCFTSGVTPNKVFSKHGVLYNHGKWAEILPQEKTVVPMEKALKIIAKKMKVSPENIEIKN